MQAASFFWQKECLPRLLTVVFGFAGLSAKLLLVPCNNAGFLQQNLCFQQSLND
ncbi:hypothetical protein [Paenibacillus typhae]|uniref:Uncharacterized protein n=1 Tax=Paenibacillus typhae TaxID=1174501 RepID=A0A1G9A3Q4_9BACL|nr:hypothetical protein [Paenibacillus typhae]SDK21861.1 hypothetical protein SAMN05216192_13520 [Paenibacillus typhae]